MQTLRAPTTAGRGEAGARRATTGAAWLLDANAFHAELDDLIGHLFGPQGPEPLRRRATELWRSTDPLVSDYLARLPCDTPEEWEASFEEGHLAQWYRILMADHIRPVRSLEDPAGVCRALGTLGLSAAEARRMTRGRELAELVAAHGSPTTAATISLTLPSGLRGWFDHADARTTIEHLCSLDRRRFRDNQDAVPLCEDLYACLQVAPDAPGWVVLITRC